MTDDNPADACARTRDAAPQVPDALGQWNGSRPLIRPTIREELGMWGGGGADQPTRSAVFGGVSGRSMIVRETTNVIGMAAAAATSGAYRLLNPARSTSR